jgi:ABC-type uncharacterized transport system ATPase subunit
MPGPTSGVCRVAGLEPSRDRARTARNVGVVFGHRMGADDPGLWITSAAPGRFLPPLIREVMNLRIGEFE